jgi:hypothetical protein
MVLLEKKKASCSAHTEIERFPGYVTIRKKKEATQLYAFYAVFYKK